MHSILGRNLSESMESVFHKYSIMVFDEGGIYVTKERPIPCKCTMNKDGKNTVHLSDSFLDPFYYEDKSDMQISEDFERVENITAMQDRYRYGWGKFKTSFLQKMNTPIYFLIVLCMIGIAQGLVVTGVAFTVITSIEKQFGLRSTEAGLFGTIYDVAYGICGVFVGYVGYKHKPRWLGYGLLLMSVGAIIFTLPKYLIGEYVAGISRDTDYCSKENASNDNLCHERVSWYYKSFFYLGKFIMGVGATPIYTLGPAHLEEITERGQGSLYLGIFYAACALGPGLGFIIGLPILSTWVDINQPPNSSLKPTDRNWVGAWWIGYLLGAVLLFIPVIPMLGFPRVFPNSKSVRTRKSQWEDAVQEDVRLRHDLQSLWPATKSLLMNPPFIFICLAIASESLTIAGFSTFLPKFVETQFHVSASDASFYTGLIVIPGAAGGIFLGGVLIKKYEWTCKKILKISSIMAFIATFCVTISLVGCPGTNVDGMKNGALNDVMTTNTSCLSLCWCSQKYYKPICAVEERVTYYSPCHAGCVKANYKDDRYENCSCFEKASSYAIDGRCTEGCNLFPLFVVGALLLMFFTFINNVPMLEATFRVVPEGQSSFAMGVQEVFVRFLGFIPAPTLFGSFIDMSCKLWHEDECTGETSSCLEYNNGLFRYYIFSLGVITKFLSFVFMYLAYHYYKTPHRSGVRQTSNEPLTNGNLDDSKDSSSEVSSNSPTFV